MHETIKQTDHTSEALLLVVNTGSSSIKMALFAMPSEKVLMRGLAERLGQAEAILSWTIADKTSSQHLIADNVFDAMQKMLEDLFGHVDKSRIFAVGHRVVHGGERFIEPTRLDASVMDEIEALSHLAPLHNPANLAGIRAAMALLSDIPHVAVFDTAFHHAMPPHAYLYAVPYSWYREHGVRRYGFHGSSHHYVSQQAAELLGMDVSDCRLLTAHLGNGCSAAAIDGGMSVDTSMGMTPLEGLVMGTRSGDVDPGLHDYIARQTGDSLATITEILNRKSGLLGLSGRSNDMRTLLEASDAGDEQATLAIDVFCYRLAKSMAALSVALEHIDAIVFTGGIGEKASSVRTGTLKYLPHFGIKLDAQRNEEHGRFSNGYISQSAAALPILVIATNEEKMIARHVSTLVKGECS